MRLPWNRKPPKDTCPYYADGQHWWYYMGVSMHYRCNGCGRLEHERPEGYDWDRSLNGPAACVAPVFYAYTDGPQEGVCAKYKGHAGPHRTLEQAMREAHS